jgi:hypothetical protein
MLVIFGWFNWGSPIVFIISYLFSIIPCVVSPDFNSYINLVGVKVYLLLCFKIFQFERLDLICI